MFDDIVDDEKILKQILTEIQSLDIENTNTEKEICEQIYNTEEFKAYAENNKS